MTYKLRAGVVLLALLTVGFAIPAFAADWPPIDPADVAMTTLPQQPGAPAVALYHEETADDMNNVHTVYMRIKILTEKGRDKATVEIPYSRRDFVITEVNGRTVHADGSVVPFEGKPFDKVILKDRGRQYKVKAFTLPDVQVGSIIDYRYNLRYADHLLYAPEWILQDDLFQKRESFKFTFYQGRYTIAWSTHLPVGPQPEMHNYPHSGTDAQRRTAMDWVGLDMSNVPAIAEEPFSPPLKTMCYRVRFYYVLVNKKEDFWKEEGKHWNKDVEGFVGRNHGVLEAVNQTVAAGDTPEQKAQKLYTFVAGFENRSYIPSRPEEEQRMLGLKPNAGAETVLLTRPFEVSKRHT